MPVWAEVTRTLASAGISVPPGFAVTAAAYRTYIETNDLTPKLRKHLDGLSQRQRVSRCGRRRHSPPQSPMRGFRHLSTNRSAPPIANSPSAAGRRTWRWPSAAAPPRRICRRQASPASRKPISMCAGNPSCLRACRRCYASLFTNRASCTGRPTASTSAGRAVDRHSKNGACRSRWIRRDVHARHGNRVFPVSSSSTPHGPW